MKSRSREINVFSMSALDLFASALGAFILISIVLMPYFLRVEPEEVQRLRRALTQAQTSLNETRQQLRQAQRESDEAQLEIARAQREGEQAERESAQARRQLEEARQQVDEAQRQLEEARREIERMQRELEERQEAPTFSFPSLDVVIAVDTSGSMGDAVEGLRSDIDQFAELMLELAPSLGIGVIDFEDRCQMSTAVREYPLRLMNPAGLRSLLSFTGSLRADSPACNTDAEEALARALDTAIASSWRPESEARIIVIITDNPAYPDKQAYALASARAFAARGSQFKVSTVFTDTGGAVAGTETFLRGLADAGNGNFTRGGGSFVVTMLVSLAGL